MPIFKAHIVKGQTGDIHGGEVLKPEAKRLLIHLLGQVGFTFYDANYKALAAELLIKPSRLPSLMQTLKRTGFAEIRVMPRYSAWNFELFEIIGGGESQIWIVSDTPGGAQGFDLDLWIDEMDWAGKVNKDPSRM